MAAYGTTNDARISYWTRQINYATEKVRPAFAASDTLIKQYENEPASGRERLMEQQQGLESHLSRIKANLIFGWIEQSIANLLERHPTFTISPQSPEAANGGPVVAAVSNYWYRETGQLRQDERVLLDAFLCPYGVKKLGWTADFEQRIGDILDENEEAFDFGDDIEAETLFLLTGEPTRVTSTQDHVSHIEAHVRALQDPNIDAASESTLQEHVDRHEKIRYRADPDRNASVQWESPFGIRWNPADFLVDPLAQDGLNDAQWIAFRSRRRIEDIKANPNYENTSDLETSERPPGAPSQDSTMEEDDFGLVTLFEIWVRDFPTGNNRREDLLIVMAEGHDKLLRHDTEWPYNTIEGFPAEMLVFQQTINEWFTRPTLVMAGGDNIQGLANEILDSFLNVVRKSKNAILYDPDLVQASDIDQILQAPDMSAFPVRGLAEAQGRAVQAVDFGNIGSEKGELLTLIQGLFDRAAGTPQPVAQSIDTATEASIAERRTSAREGRRGSLMAEYQISIAKKFWQMTTQFRPERLFMIHPQAPEWAAIDGEIVKGEYRFRIDISSQAANLALERKNHLDLLNLFAGLAGVFQQQYGKPPNLAKLAERLLTRGYGEQAPEEILPMLAEMQGQGALDPQAQAAIQAQLEGTPGQVPTGGPDLNAPPTEVEREDQIGPALPGLFNEPATSPAAQGAEATRV